MASSLALGAMMLSEVRNVGRGLAIVRATICCIHDAINARYLRFHQ